MTKTSSITAELAIIRSRRPVLLRLALRGRESHVKSIINPLLVRGSLGILPRFFQEPEYQSAGQ